MKLILIFILSIFSSLFILAQEDYALMIPEQDTLDFGITYEADGKILINVPLKNNGNGSLKINKIYSPDLVVKEYTENSISQDSKGEILLELNPFSKVGYYEKDLIIFSNAVNSPVKIKVKGKIVGGSHSNKFKYRIGSLTFKQSQLNFGYIFKGKELIRYLPVHNTSEEFLTVKFNNIPSYLKIIPGFDSLGPGKTGMIEVRYNTNLCDDWDFVIDRISVTVIGEKKVEGKVTFTSNIRENFGILSEEQYQNRPIADIPVRVYNFDTIFGNESAKYSYLLINKGNSTLNIRALKPTCGCTAALSDENTLQPGDSTYINVEFDASGYSGMVKQGVSVITDDPKNYKQFIWIAGVVK